MCISNIPETEDSLLVTIINTEAIIRSDLTNTVNRAAITEDTNYIQIQTYLLNYNTKCVKYQKPQTRYMYSIIYYTAENDINM